MSSIEKAEQSFYVVCKLVRSTSRRGVITRFPKANNRKEVAGLDIKAEKVVTASSSEGLMRETVS